MDFFKEILNTKIAACPDVLVAGGGIAGVAAAIAAARSGAKVILMEKECALGGLGTLGLVVIYLPLCDGYGHQVIGGLGEEMLKRSMQYGRGEIPACWRTASDVFERIDQRYQVTYDAAPMMLSLEEMLLEAGVDIWYDTRFCGCRMNGEKIDAAMVENKSGRLAIRAKVYVDCTGDADVCHAAGEETISSDQNRRSGWFFSYDGQKVRLRPHSDPLYESCPKDSRFYRGDDGREVSQYVMDMHRFILRKNQEDSKRMGQEEFPLIIPSIPLMRMTRRLSGVCTITSSQGGTFLPDTVGLTGDWRRPAPVYSIPFGALYGPRVKNLLVAGRCISAEGDAWDVVRVIPACAVSGEAAGTAAARLARTGGKSVAELDVGGLQEELASKGVIMDPALVDCAI